MTITSKGERRNMEEMSATDISRLIEWLRNHGHTDAEIVECLEYITKK